MTKANLSTLNWGKAVLDVLLIVIGVRKRRHRQIPSGSPNRWLIQGENLYFTSRIENVAMINKVHLESGMAEAEELAKNRFMLDFDIRLNPVVWRQGNYVGCCG